MRALFGVLLFILFTVEPEGFFRGYWHTVMSSAAPLFKGNPINLWDLAIILLGLAVAARPSTWRQRARPLDQALLALMSILFAAMVWGALRGGQVRMAYYQLAGLLRMVLLMHVVLGLFRTPRDFVVLTRAVLAAALYRAVACIIFFWFYVKTGIVQPWPEDMTDHHDSTLWVTSLVGIFSWVLATRRLRTALKFAVPTVLLLLAIQYNDRRIAWLELAGGIALVCAVIPPSPFRRTLVRRALLTVPIVLIYVAIGWGRPQGVFTPVRQIRSALSSDKSDTSNLYRELENAGLVLTLQGNRLLGTGLGQPFQEVSTVFSRGLAARWPEYRFQPHNSVVGLAAFTGLVGFPVAWLFLPVTSFLAARTCAFARDQRTLALGMIAFASPWIFGVQAFGDMGLQSIKSGALLACAMAAASRLAVATGAWPARRTSSRP